MNFTIYSTLMLTAVCFQMACLEKHTSNAAFWLFICNTTQSGKAVEAIEPD